MEGIIGAIFSLFFGGFFILWFIIVSGSVVFSIFSVVFWVLMIVDVCKREFPKKDDKLVWTLVVVLAGIVGSLVYYFMIVRAAKKNK
jgi:nitric oxide reductase large subunit